MSLRGYLEALRLVNVIPEPTKDKAPAARITTIQQPAPALSDPTLGDFEVNMMECLVGWKGLCTDGNGVLYSRSYPMPWLPCKPAKGFCRCGLDVTVHHCGIYAADGPDEAHQYGPVLTQVYGWGRYIRGDRGWRAQLAYPKAFYLTKHQANLIEVLKKYCVDIYIDEPLRIYSAEEDGYEHGQGEAEGYRRAVEGSDTHSEGSACGATED